MTGPGRSSSLSRRGCILPHCVVFLKFGVQFLPRRPCISQLGSLYFRNDVDNQGRATLHGNPLIMASKAVPAARRSLH
jgi:hypothetical protein